MAVLGFLSAVTITVLVLSIAFYEYFPAPTFILPVLVGGVLLRTRPLAWLCALAVACAALAATIETVSSGELVRGRAAAVAVLFLSSLLLLYIASRNRSGLPGPLGDAMLMDLRDRLQRQSTVPPLPDGWRAESAQISADGAKFAGDFLVANVSSDQRYLEMILVDVCGKGVGAGTQSLQFAGALGALIGSLPQHGLFAAANDFLLRQRWDEGFATAVHVFVDMESGRYSIMSAGHPPALRWDAARGEWIVDGARGVPLGVVDFPEFSSTSGHLEPGEALLFYTDGVIETRGRDLDDGVEWLRLAARASIIQGMSGVPKRIINGLPATGDDDCAILIVTRRP